MNSLGRGFRAILAAACPRSVLRRAARLGLVFACATSAAGNETEPAKKAPDLTEIPLEALMNIEVPGVYGASKTEQ